MGISSKCFCVLNHVFDGSIRPVGSSVVDIHTFKLDFEGTDVLSVKTNHILSNMFNF